MKVSKEDNAENRVKMLRAASATIREHGAAQASVAGIAGRAGLTHGAVYRHFPSKTALVAAAVESAFDDIALLLERLGEEGAGPAGYVRTYLSPDHRDHYPWGCPAAPLAAEMPRLEPQVQQAFVAGLQRNIDGLVSLGAEQGLDRAKATAMLATLVGALALARAARPVDAALSDRIMADARHALLDGLAPK